MDRLKFMLAGNATFTIVSKKTGVRFTYRIVKEVSPISITHYVRVLTGPDQYTYLGVIFKDQRYGHGRSSTISSEAPSAQAFTWFWNDVETTKIEFHHAGKCGRCGRELTVPESVESGLGPECARRAG